jgi:predicted DNA-binding transcriptional regulator AlpA
LRRILSLTEVAGLEGCSRRTVERQINLGLGPDLVQISQRRVGVREDDYANWVERRRRPAPREKVE